LHERPGAEQGAACLSCRESRGPFPASLRPHGNSLLRFEVRASTRRTRPQEPCRIAGCRAPGGEGLGGGRFVATGTAMLQGVLVTEQRAAKLVQTLCRTNLGLRGRKRIAGPQRQETAPCIVDPLDPACHRARTIHTTHSTAGSLRTTKS